MDLGYFIPAVAMTGMVLASPHNPSGSIYVMAWVVKGLDSHAGHLLSYLVEDHLEA